MFLKPNYCIFNYLFFLINYNNKTNKNLNKERNE
jgi:hypothetical protein